VVNRLARHPAGARRFLTKELLLHILLKRARIEVADLKSDYLVAAGFIRTSLAIFRDIRIT